MKGMYIRTSTEDQEPRNQIKDIETISGNEYELYIDKQSAWKDKDRDEFERLKKDIKSKKITEVYCWDWDRLFRNRKKLKEFFAFCGMYKCKIHSFRQKFFEDFYNIPSPFDEIIQELVLNLMGWLAEDESSKKSGRVKAAVKKKNGVTVSYKGNKWGRKSISTQAINKIISLRKEGKSITEISNEVSYAGKNNKSKNVSRGLVHKILTENKEKLGIKSLD